MIIPEEKAEIGRAREQIAEVENQYKKGVITDGERYNKIIDIWTHATEETSNVMFRVMEYNDNKDHINPIFIMVDSGARGSSIRQLAGMRGLMAKPSVRSSNVRSSRISEGLTVLEYFISTHGTERFG